MTFTLKRIINIMLLIFIGIMIIVALLGYAGLRINTTRSIPLGVYWIIQEPIKKGSYVIFCPPKNKLFDEAKRRGYLSAGFCDGGYAYMMKRIAAINGDIVFIDSEGVRVNGNLLPMSKPRKHDVDKRPMFIHSPKKFILKDTELLLMSDISHISFDSRYFGAINVSQIKGVIQPVFTW